MKPAADLEQRLDIAVDLDASHRRSEVLRYEFQKRGLTRAVTADDAKAGATLQLEIDVSECPELPIPIIPTEEVREPERVEQVVGFGRKDLVHLSHTIK